MNRDIKFITVVSAIYGLCSGMFGVLFTLYLDELNISLSTMGVMFSVSSLLGFLVMVILGAQSDVWGRKVVYSVSILLTAISSFFVPFLRGVGELTISKIVKDLAFRTRTSIHSTLVFEHVRKGYAKIIARIQGIQLTLSAAGLMMASTVLSYLGFQGVFIAIGIMLFIAFLIFQIVREPAKPKAKRKSIREMYRFDISKQLKILCVFNFIHGIGFSICHTVFIYTLFFLKKFAVEPLTLSLILGLHNFTFGVPMILASRLFSKPNPNYTKILMIGNLLAGVSFFTSAFIPILIPATAIWFIHDILGASLRMPAQQTLTQNYSRDEYRGKDVNMASAFSSIGKIFGPVIGGYLAGIDISLPFLVGGSIIAATTMILIPLNRMKKAS